ncbi:MerR family transcriptional regulator [Paenibacillus lautus]|uniref:MerR family transcriptional regulator n=1 Tax=Paenibacillus lautus TaxID=1401 RepID=UPI003D2B9AF9
MYSYKEISLQRDGNRNSVTHKDETYSIGQVAALLGSTVKTVRYYDKIGLLKPSNYTEGGHRLYAKDDIWRLQLITTLRFLDFEIDDIRRLIAGEIEIASALDWQIESLEAQVSTLTSMISILRQAKTHDEDSLDYIQDLVKTRTTNSEKRNQFMMDKLEDSKFLDGVPQEWRRSFLYFFNKCIVNQVKITAKQAFVWDELQALINDPQFIPDLVQDEFLFFNMVNQPRWGASVWPKMIEDIQNRLNTALERNLPAGSPFVQSIVENAAMLYANAEQSMNQEDVFRYFEEYAKSPRTERIKRFNTLCAILSPEYRLFSKGNNLLLQGIEWRLGHM